MIPVSSYQFTRDSLVMFQYSMFQGRDFQLARQALIKLSLWYLFSLELQAKHVAWAYLSWESTVTVHIKLFTQQFGVNVRLFVFSPLLTKGERFLPLLRWINCSSHAVFLYICRLDQSAVSIQQVSKISHTCLAVVLPSFLKFWITNFSSQDRLAISGEMAAGELLKLFPVLNTSWFTEIVSPEEHLDPLKKTTCW